MFYALILIAVVIAVGEVLAAKMNKRTKLNSTSGKKWLLVYRWRWLVGAPFAIASAFIYYPMSGKTETYKVMGFPLFVAAFDQAGRDYVGPFTAPFFVGNAVLWYFMPHFFLSAWAYYEKRVNKNA